MKPGRSLPPAYVGADLGWCHRCRNYFTNDPPKRFAGIRGPDSRRSYEGSVLCVDCDDYESEGEAHR